MRWPPLGIIPRAIRSVAQRPHVRPDPPQLHLLDPFDFLQVVEVLLDRPAVERRLNDLHHVGFRVGAEVGPPRAVRWTPLSRPKNGDPSLLSVRPSCS